MTLFTIGVWWLANLAFGVAGLPRWGSRHPRVVTILCALAFLAAPPIIGYLEPWLLTGPIQTYSSSGVAGLLVANIILMNLWRWYALLFLLYWVIYLVAVCKRGDNDNPSPADGAE